MAEKTIKTRIINKHGALADWLASSTILKEGEIALAYVETTKPDGQGGTYTIPTYLMKVGDNEHTFSELEWVAAPASDVYAWAKKENLALSDIPMAEVTNTLKETFYTESEVDAKLAQKSDNHNHPYLPDTTKYAASSSVGGAANKVANKMTVKLNSGTTEGTNLFTYDGSAAKTINITPSAIGASASGHTHDDRYYTESEIDSKLAGKSDTHNHPYLPDTTTYAGSSTKGGAATSANKVNAALTFNNGGKGVASGTTFDGSTARTVSYNTIGAAPASHNHDDRYYTEDEVDSKLSGKSDTSHNHDSSYYKKTEVDTKISNAVSSVLRYQGTKNTTADLPTSGQVKGDVWNITTACVATETLPAVNAGDNVAWNGTGWDVLAGTVDLSNYYTETEADAKFSLKDHTHNYAGSSSAGGAANSVKAALTFSTSGNGAANGTTYNGSTARTISYNSVGAAPASHTHTKSEITDFAHNHDERYYTETESDAKFAVIGHTHTTSLASDTGTETVTLTHGGKFKLTAGGTSVIFKMPSDNNTHNTSKNIVGASNSATANAQATNGNVYLNHLEQSSVTSSHKISGSGATSVSADASGNITITSQNTAHSHSAGVGLVGSGSSGTSGGTYDYKVALVNETKASNASAYAAGAASKFYSVQLDKDGKLAVNVPWTDNNTHHVTRIYAGASGKAANAAATNPYIKVTDDNTYRNQIQLKGAIGTKVSSDASGVVTVEALPATNDSGETMTYIFDCGGPND